MVCQVLYICHNSNRMPPTTTKPRPTAKKQPPGQWLDFDLIVGIDPGKKTGLACYYAGSKRLKVDEMPIWDAFNYLRDMSELGIKVFVILEDARKTYRPKGVSLEDSEAKKMGAGWIRTLSCLYEDYLKALRLPYRTQKKGITKLTAAQFFGITKLETKEANHNARDAGMMVWQHPFRIFVTSKP